MATETVYLGIDPSLANTAFAIVRRRGKRWAAEAEVARTSPRDDLADRLVRIGAATEDACARALRHGAPVVIAMEDFARVTLHRREEMGMAAGVILSAARRFALGAARDAKRIRWGAVDLVNIREAKRIVCPDWHGWGLAEWVAVGYPPPFKRSMPTKAAVNASLFKRYRIDLRDEHEADAACVALARASRDG